MRNLNIYFKGKIILSLLMMSISMISCKDYLDITPKANVSDNTLWASEANADFFLNGIYGSIRGPIDFFDCGDNYTDNSLSPYTWTDSEGLYLIGNVTPTNGSNLQQWDQFNKIRQCNVFISKAGASNLDEAWKKLRIAEA